MMSIGGDDADDIDDDSDEDDADGEPSKLAIDGPCRSSQTGSARTAGPSAPRQSQRRALRATMHTSCIPVFVGVQDVRCILRVLERLRCQRRPTVSEHAVRVGLAE